MRGHMQVIKETELNSDLTFLTGLSEVLNPLKQELIPLVEGYRKFKGLDDNFLTMEERELNGLMPVQTAFLDKWYLFNLMPFFGDVGELENFPILKQQLEIAPSSIGVAGCVLSVVEPNFTSFYYNDIIPEAVTRFIFVLSAPSDSGVTVYTSNGEQKIPSEEGKGFVLNRSGEFHKPYNLNAQLPRIALLIDVYVKSDITDEDKNLYITEIEGYLHGQV